jgi:hypothetical protein
VLRRAGLLLPHAGRAGVAGLSLGRGLIRLLGLGLGGLPLQSLPLLRGPLLRGGLLAGRLLGLGLLLDQRPLLGLQVRLRRGQGLRGLLVALGLGLLGR